MATPFVRGMTFTSRVATADINSLTFQRRAEKNTQLNDLISVIRAFKSIHRTGNFHRIPLHVYQAGSGIPY